MTDENNPSDDIKSGELDIGDGGGAAPASIESLTAERDQYLEMARRARADLENYQKRVNREIEAERKYAAIPLLRDLLPAIDNLERALASADAKDTSKAAKSDPAGIVDGVRIVHRQFVAALEKHGAMPIDPVGQAFDPNEHEAVMQQLSDQAPMTVLQTLQKGYRMHERVIRPAQVIVAAAPS